MESTYEEQPEVLPKKLTWAERFREVHPNIEVSNVAHKACILSQGRKMNADSLRVQMLNENSPLNRGQKPELDVLLEEILNALNKDSFYINNKMWMKLERLDDFIRWICLEKGMSVRALLRFESGDAFHNRYRVAMSSGSEYMSCSRRDYEALMARIDT